MDKQKFFWTLTVVVGVVGALVLVGVGDKPPIMWLAFLIPYFVMWETVYHALIFGHGDGKFNVIPAKVISFGVAGMLLLLLVVIVLCLGAAVSLVLGFFQEGGFVLMGLALAVTVIVVVVGWAWLAVNKRSAEKHLGKEKVNYLGMDEEER